MSNPPKFPRINLIASELVSLRRWCLEMGGRENDSDVAIARATKFESYVLNGAPAKACKSAVRKSKLRQASRKQ